MARSGEQFLKGRVSGQMAAAGFILVGEQQARVLSKSWCEMHTEWLGNGTGCECSGILLNLPLFSGAEGVFLLGGTANGKIAFFFFFMKRQVHKWSSEHCYFK